MNLALNAPVPPIALRPEPDRRLSVAPMMARTDRHYRVLARLVTRRTLLYTEMVPASALAHGDRERLVGFDPLERPLALQIGGSDPRTLAACAREAEARGFDEVNLNVGCPSERVRSGRFGACLMAEPEVVAHGVAAMRAATALPVTVKSRIGIDDRDRYEDLLAFVDTVAAAGCRTFVVHARKAWLRGLSPKENRTLPPLRPDVVKRLKRERPDLEIVLNGGVDSIDAATAHLDAVDGVMIGRAAYRDPWLLAEADRRCFGDDAPVPPRATVVARYLEYVEAAVARGVPAHAMTRHLLGLYQGRPGARAWRASLSAGASAGRGLPAIRAALARIEAA